MFPTTKLVFLVTSVTTVLTDHVCDGPGWHLVIKLVIFRIVFLHTTTFWCFYSMVKDFTFSPASRQLDIDCIFTQIIIIIDCTQIYYCKKVTNPFACQKLKRVVNFFLRHFHLQRQCWCWSVGLTMSIWLFFSNRISYLWSGLFSFLASFWFFDQG